MKRKTRYTRNGRRIDNLVERTFETFESINAAKRKSRQLQGGDLGSGLLRKDSK